MLANRNNVIDLNTEIRKLPPAHIYTLSALLNNFDSWKKLMAIVPKENNTGYKFDSDHFSLIEQASKQQKRSCAEIFLDEWSTMGKIRPKVQDLINLLVQAELFRPADYIAIKILNQKAGPRRPNAGPAAQINLSLSLLDDLTEVTDTTSFSGEVEEDENVQNEQENVQQSTHEEVVLPQALNPPLPEFLDGINFSDFSAAIASVGSLGINDSASNVVDSAIGNSQQLSKEGNLLEQNNAVENIQPSSGVENIQPSSDVENIQPSSGVENIQPSIDVENIQRSSNVENIQPSSEKESSTEGNDSEISTPILTNESSANLSFVNDNNGNMPRFLDEVNDSFFNSEETSVSREVEERSQNTPVNKLVHSQDEAAEFAQEKSKEIDLSKENAAQYQIPVSFENTIGSNANVSNINETSKSHSDCRNEVEERSQNTPVNKIVHSEDEAAGCAQEKSKEIDLSKENVAQYQNSVSFENTIRSNANVSNINETNKSLSHCWNQVPQSPFETGVIDSSKVESSQNITQDKLVRHPSPVLEEDLLQKNRLCTIPAFLTDPNYSEFSEISEDIKYSYNIEKCKTESSEHEANTSNHKLADDKDKAAPVQGIYLLKENETPHIIPAFLNDLNFSGFSEISEEMKVANIKTEESTEGDSNKANGKVSDVTKDNAVPGPSGEKYLLKENDEQYTIPTFLNDSNYSGFSEISEGIRYSYRIEIDELSEINSSELDKKSETKDSGVDEINKSQLGFSNESSFFSSEGTIPSSNVEKSQNPLEEPNVQMDASVLRQNGGDLDKNDAASNSFAHDDTGCNDLCNSSYCTRL